MSFLRPNCRWRPKYSSATSWLYLSVKTNYIPWLSKNLTVSMQENTVICKPSYVWYEINIRLLSCLLYRPFRSLILIFHLKKYGRNSSTSHFNRLSMGDLNSCRKEQIMVSVIPHGPGSPNFWMMQAITYCFH